MKLRLLFLFSALNLAIAQNLTSPQATGMAGFSTFTNSALSFTLNPAGLMRIYDWNIGLTAYFEPNFGTKMHSFGVAKRISETQSVGFLYSPGSMLEFIFPSNITINLGNTTLTAEFSRKITYTSNYTFGYAFKPTEKINLGFSTSYVTQTLLETRYKIISTDSLPNLSIETTQYKSPMLKAKLASIYEINRKTSLGLSVENISFILGEKMPDELKNFELQNDLKIKLSIGLSLKNFNSGFEISSIGEVITGFEFSPVENLFLRAGVFSDIKNFTTFSIGAGFRTGLFQFDIAYFKNMSKIWKDGKLTQAELTETPIRDVEFNKFIRDRISFSISIDATSWYEKSLRIKKVELEEEIFPHLISNFEKKKIGFIEIENTSRKTLNAKIDFELSSPNGVPTIDINSEPEEISIKPNEVKTIPVFVSTGLNKVENSEPIKIFAKMKVKSVKQIPDAVEKLKILLRGKNDWDGNVENLKFFVKVDHPEIVSFARKVIWDKKDTLEIIDPALRKFYQAKFLFDELSKHITYVSDPSLSIDKVQYPEETLKLHTGDCDDLVVLYASLLSSIGIDVAFVDVRAMRKIDESHVYILFDSGLDKKFASVITSNEKKYVVLKNRSGVETVWIPLETTSVRHGFDKAWEIGAEEFFKDFEINLAQAKGKARIIFLENPN